MSIERKVRMAYRIQIVCLAATAGLVIALVIAQPGTEISAILLLVAQEASRRFTHEVKVFVKENRFLALGASDKERRGTNNRPTREPPGDTSLRYAVSPHPAPP